MAWTYEVHELSEGFSAIVYDDRGRAVADHLSEDRARLIAAAPELLEALKALRGYIVIQYTEFGDVMNDRAVNDLNAIDAAIAKAEGRP